MNRRPPRSTRTDPLFPYATPFRSPAGLAYHDRVDADYHIATGGDRTEWNDGRTYRNDGVDIVREADGAPFVDRFEAGEWMQYTITAEHGGTARLVLATAATRAATIGVRVNDGPQETVTGRAANGWAGRSEERREGKECVSTGRTRGAPYHEKKKKRQKNRNKA